MHLIEALNNGDHIDAENFETRNWRNLARSLFRYEFGYDVITLDQNNTEIEDANYCIYTGPAETNFMNVTHLSNYFTEI